MRTRFQFTTCFIILHSSFVISTLAQGTAFTYQGRLNEGENPTSGTYDLRFTIYDAVVSGSVVAGPLTNSATLVSNGLLTVTLDFGAGVFTGADRWLEVAVRTNNGGSFTPLHPRQPIAATPQAIYAASSSSAAALSGPLPASQLMGAISSSNIAPGSITKVMLAEGAVTTPALADGAVTPLKVATTYLVPLTTTITNPTPLDGEAFGFSVAVVGSDWLLIGTPYEDREGGYAGAAYLFHTNGTLLTTMTNPAPAAGDYFGWSGVAVGGDRMLIGAPADSIGATADGAAYLFSTNGSLLTTFTNPTPAFDESFGQSLATLGRDRVLIGASGDNTGGAYAGAAYLFHTNGALLTTFKKPSPTANEYFGRSVAVVGSDRVLIGAPGVSIGASHAGAAYLFNTNGALLTTLTNPAPAIGDNFGEFLTVVGSDRLLIGARGKAVGGQSVVGAAYLLSTNGTLLTTFTNPSPAFSDQFGFSVSAVGNDRVLIGAIGDDAGADNAGAAYLFSTSGTLLTTLTNPIPVDGALFGHSAVALGSDRVFIGAVGGTGAVYQFSLESFASGLVAESVRSGAITSASLADGAVSAAKLDPAIGLWSASGQDVYRPSGGVGIGTNNPGSAALAVAGNANVAGRLSANSLAVGGIASASGFASSALGYNSTASGNYSIAMGYGAQAVHGSSFVWSDGTTFTSSANNQFLIRATGGVGIGTASPQASLHVYSANNPTVLRLHSAAGFGAARLEFLSDPPGSASEWRPGYIQSTDNGGFTGGLAFVVNGSGVSNRFGAVETMRIVDGKVGIGSTAPTTLLQVGNATCNGSTWNNASDRNAKENFNSVDARAVLEKVAALPLSQWNYKTDPESRHLGPTAQDFHAAFGLGDDDKHIATVDADGVALAAIQALHGKLREQQLELDRRRIEIAELKDVLEKLRHTVDKLTHANH